MSDRLDTLLRHTNKFGALHIVIEDLNVEDEHLDMCEKNATEIEKEILCLLRKMSPRKRKKAILKSELP